MSIRKWIIFSGMTWLTIGGILMVKGLRWIVGSLYVAKSAPLVELASRIVGAPPQGALIVISMALLLGFVKGRVVLSKAVQRVILRLRSLPPPIRFSNAYDKRYMIVLGSMMALGFIFRFLPFPLDIRGAIDVAIGSALINGAMLYFREAFVPSYQR